MRGMARQHQGIIDWFKQGKFQRNHRVQKNTHLSKEEKDKVSVKTKCTKPKAMTAKSKSRRNSAQETKGNKENISTTKKALENDSKKLKPSNTDTECKRPKCNPKESESDRMDSKKGLSTCCLPEVPLTNKGINSLKIKRWQQLRQANGYQKRAEVTRVISENNTL